MSPDVVDKGLSMAARREVTKKYAREYAKADKVAKGELLDALVATTGWTRDHARCAIRHADARMGAARDQQRRPRPLKYSYDSLVVLQEVWRLAGQPLGKYLAAVMDDTLERLVRVGELGKVDGGGGGTIAKYVANMNVDVVDLGVPVLSMHAPFEIVSKTDVYMAYRAFFTFFDTKD